MKALEKCSKFQISTPRHVESLPKEGLLVLEKVNGVTMKEALDEKTLAEGDCGTKMGEIVGQIHARGIVHGDLTTSNFMLENDKAVIIDFGLGKGSFWANFRSFFDRFKPSFQP